MFSVTRYAVRNYRLKQLVKFIWYLETKPGVSINNKLLPTDSIDIIINLSEHIEYNIENRKYRASNIHFNGMRDKYGFIVQSGKINVYGISFYPFGLYPFLQTPISEFKGEIVDLSLLSKKFVHKLELALNSVTRVEDIIVSLEEALVSILDMNREEEMIQLIKIFDNEKQNCTIKSFCDDNNVNIKTLERACLKYTGYTPKGLQRVGRFRLVSNQLIYNDNNNNLANLAYENEYYDQAHFIREFKTFSGTSPSKFIQERKTVKENTRYEYK